MRKILVLSAVTGMLLLGNAGAQAQELLTNGNLDDPGAHETDVAAGWTLVEGPGPVNSATFASFANNTPVGSDPTQVGLWYRAFEGGETGAVSADLTQSVAGAANTRYLMSGWARYETNFPGGAAGDPTDTLFALEFLDGANSILPGSISIDLMADGQTNDGNWLKHSLSALSPAGTVNVRVRASMINGHSVTANPQSAFIDDFSLTVVPEPTTLVLAGLGLVAVLTRGRRR